MKCFACGQIGHLIKNCPQQQPTQSTSIVPSGDNQIGVWPNGAPKYFCKFHNREVGHQSSVCILRNSRPFPTGAAAQPPGASQDSLAQCVREAIADALPPFASDLLRYNIKYGIRVHLSRASTEKDATTLKSSLTRVKVVYFKNKEVMLGFDTSDDRDTALQRLKISKDGETLLSYEIFTGPKCTQTSLLPIVLGEPPIALDGAESGKRPAEPSTSGAHAAKRTRPTDEKPQGAMEVDDDDTAPDHVKTIDDRVSDLETGLGEVRTRVGQIEGKLDAAISSKIELKSFSKADQIHPNEVLPGRILWFCFRRSSIEPWIPTRGSITAVTGDKFQAVAVDQAGVTIPSVQVQGASEHLPKDEATAKK